MQTDASGVMLCPTLRYMKSTLKYRVHPGVIRPRATLRGTNNVTTRLERAGKFKHR